MRSRAASAKDNGPASSTIAFEPRLPGASFKSHGIARATVVLRANYYYFPRVAVVGRVKRRRDGGGAADTSLYTPCPLCRGDDRPRRYIGRRYKYNISYCCGRYSRIREAAAATATTAWKTAIWTRRRRENIITRWVRTYAWRVGAGTFFFFFFANTAIAARAYRYWPTRHFTRYKRFWPNGKKSDGDNILAERRWANTLSHYAVSAKCRCRAVQRPSFVTVLYGNRTTR